MSLPSPRQRRRHTPLAATAAALGLALLLSGCGGGPRDVILPVEPNGGAGGVSLEQRPADTSDPAAESAARQMIASATVRVAVPDPAATAERVETLAGELGGRVDSLSVNAETEYSGESAQLTVRVPADRIDEAMDRLAELGTLVERGVSGQDVTEVHVDLEARLASLRGSLARFEALRDQAGSTAELIEAERALAERQAEIDGLQAQLDSLTGQIELASIWVSLETPGSVPSPQPAPFWQAILSGFASMGTVFFGAIALIGFLLPWAALLLVVVLLWRGIARARRGRAGRDTAAPAPTAPAPTAPTATPGAAADAEPAAAPPAEDR